MFCYLCGNQMPDEGVWLDEQVGPLCGECLKIQLRMRRRWFQEKIEEIKAVASTEAEYAFIKAYKDDVVNAFTRYSDMATKTISLNDGREILVFSDGSCVISCNLGVFYKSLDDLLSYWTELSEELCEKD